MSQVHELVVWRSNASICICHKYHKSTDTMNSLPSEHQVSATVLGIQCWYCHCLFIFLAQSLSGTRRYRRVESRENLQRKTGGPGQQAGRSAIQPPLSTHFHVTTEDNLWSLNIITWHWSWIGRAEAKLSSSLWPQPKKLIRRFLVINCNKKSK